MHTSMTYFLLSAVSCLLPAHIITIHKLKWIIYVFNRLIQIPHSNILESSPPLMDHGLFYLKYTNVDLHFPHNRVHKAAL